MIEVIKDRWYVFLAILVLAFFGIYRFALSPKNNAKIATYTVKRETLTESLAFSGKIDATEKAILKFQTSGYLAWVGAKEGDRVKKFQTLAALDTQDVQKTMEKYLNTYMSTRWDYETAKDNYDDQGMTSALKKILDKAQFDLNSSVLDVEIKNLAVKYASLRTPIDGLVTTTPPQVGTNVIYTQTMFEVVNPTTVYFTTTADQTDVVRLTASQSGKIALDAYPDQPIATTITSISFTPKVDETGTVYEVKMTLPIDNTVYQYRLGMTGDATFTVREIPNVIAIPTKYVKSNPDGSKYVWLKANGKKIKKSVTVGDAFDTQTEIKEGLVEGNVISEN